MKTLLGSFLFISVALQASEFNHSLIDQNQSSSNQPQLIHLSQRNLGPTVFLEMKDLVDGPAINISETPSIIARSVGRQLIAENGSQFPAVKSHLEKQIPNLWRVILPADWPTTMIPVTVNSINQPAMVVDLVPWIQRTELQKDGSQIIEGGVKLAINPLLISHSGLSAMQISIDLHSF